MSQIQQATQEQLQSKDDTLSIKEEINEERGNTGSTEDSGEMRAPETEMERKLTEELTRQFSTAWIGDGFDLWQRKLSRLGSSGLRPFVEDFQPLHESSGISIGNVDMPSALVRQNSAILAELKQESFSHYSSSGIQLPQRLFMFSRNPSFEGNQFFVPHTASMDAASAEAPDIADGDRSWKPNFGVEQPPAQPSDVIRLDSFHMDPVEMKRPRSYYSTPTVGVNKITRQNTQMQFVGSPSPIQNPSYDADYHPEMQQEPLKNTTESAKHRTLVANINGVSYRSEIKKKDKKNPKKWSSEEDELLRQAVSELGERQWKDIAMRIPGRNHVQCLQRWKKVLKPGLKKGHWTEEEDNLLRLYQPKCANWAEVAEKIEGRTAKQCRERWCNHVNPEIRKSNWTPEEDSLILSLQKQWGNRWSSIAEQLPGRSENAVKIRWKSLCRHHAQQHAKATSPPSAGQPTKLAPSSAAPLAGVKTVVTNAPPSPLTAILGRGRSYGPMGFYAPAMTLMSPDPLQMPILGRMGSGGQDMLMQEGHGDVNVPVPIQPMSRMGSSNSSVLEYMYRSGNSFSPNGADIAEEPRQLFPRANFSEFPPSTDATTALSRPNELPSLG